MHCLRNPLRIESSPLEECEFCVIPRAETLILRGRSQQDLKMSFDAQSKHSKYKLALSKLNWKKVLWRLLPELMHDVVAWAEVTRGSDKG